MSQPWITVDRVLTPEGPLELKQRGTRDFLILVGGRILMSSMAHRSEDALARLACEALPDRDRARVLVSGLGMGYTLRAALDALGPRAQVVVAELNPVVVDWCRGPLAGLTGGAAIDPRVTIHVEDVAATLARAARGPAEQRFSAVILDMYEGPRHVVDRGDPLYGPGAVARTREALVRGGTFAVWGETVSRGFERNLVSAGFRWERKRAGHGASIYVVYLAR